jgi:F0F1-type ATP synthase assembly protein I
VVFLLVFGVADLIHCHKPYNLVVGALLGLVMGTTACVTRVVLRVRQKRG